MKIRNAILGFLFFFFSALLYSAPWENLLLGAKQMMLPGSHENQIVEFYGNPSFLDERGNLWYRLEKRHFRRFKSYKKNGKTAFVLFELDDRVLTKVRVVNLCEIEKLEQQGQGQSDGVSP